MGKEEEPVAPPKEAVSLDYMTVAPQVEIRSPMAEDGTGAMPHLSGLCACCVVVHTFLIVGVGAGAWHSFGMACGGEDV